METELTQDARDAFGVPEHPDIAGLKRAHLDAYDKAMEKGAKMQVQVRVTKSTLIQGQGFVVHKDHTFMIDREDFQRVKNSLDGNLELVDRDIMEPLVMPDKSMKSGSMVTK
jgi:hypothetical protein